MALWKDQTSPAPVPSPASPTAAPSPVREAERAAPVAVAAEARRVERAPAKESVIAADLAIEGKIEGSGHVRIAGRFKGDVHVDGNLTVEHGAHLTGQVYAKTVIIAGELHGNINGAARVELLESGVLAGDVKAGTLTVAAGSRMRGHAEFGWEEKNVKSLAAG
ncbi:MAG: polymer-forming cytoskeletal protein [Gammaproteobacteria bacterium]|nr:polymer-forming cytoskeletal protein [Gammaproteobacteria bacterium]